MTSVQLMMRGLESWVAVGEDKLPTQFWTLDPRDVTKPRPDGSKYIGDYYAQLKVYCSLLRPGMKYTFYLKEQSGQIWVLEGTAQTSGFVDCRTAPVMYVNDSKT